MLKLIAEACSHYAIDTKFDRLETRVAALEARALAPRYLRNRPNARK
jgi:hypothetical protein